MQHAKRTTRPYFFCLLVLMFISLYGTARADEDEVAPQPPLPQTTAKRQQYTQDFLNLKPVPGDGTFAHRPQPYIESPDERLVKQFLAQLKKHWHPAAGQEEERTVVIFKLKGNGTIENIRVIRPSKSEEADRRAVHAIQSTAPLTITPLARQLFSNGYIELQITFPLKDQAKNLRHF